MPDLVEGAESATKIDTMKNQEGISYGWAALIGVFFPVLQGSIYYIRFGMRNPYADLLDYSLFFLAGALGGTILITLLRFSRNKLTNRSVIAAFLLSSPLAVMGMLAGSLFGLFGVILLPGAIWAIFTGIGFGLGRFLSRTGTRAG